MVAIASHIPPPASPSSLNSLGTQLAAGQVLTFPEASRAAARAGPPAPLQESLLSPTYTLGEPCAASS